MKRVVVGLDTSCYTTSAAAVTAEGNVIASCRKLLPVPQGQRGLRQSEAVFTHVRQLPGLIEELSAYLTDCEIVAVCASRRPRLPVNGFSQREYYILRAALESA